MSPLFSTVCYLRINPPCELDKMSVSPWLKNLFVKSEEPATSPPAPAVQRSPKRITRVTSCFPGDQFTEVWACGDIHGDYEALSACLRMTEAAQMTEEGVWRWSTEVGRRVALVFLGDLVDRWRNNKHNHPLSMIAYAEPDGMASSLGERRDEEKMVLRTLNALAREAPEHGGAVFRLVGNHEIMQMDDRVFADGKMAANNAALQYSSPFSMGLPSNALNDQRLAAARSRTEEFMHREMHDLLADCEPRAILQIGENVFVHGGISRPLIEGTPDFLGRCNELLHMKLAGDLKLTTQRSSADEQDFWRLLYEAGPRRGGTAKVAGILWDDDLSELVACRNGTCALASQQALEALNANNAQVDATRPAARAIVVSHCIQSDLRSKQEGSEGYVPSLAQPSELWTDYSGPLQRVQPHRYHGINSTDQGTVWRVDVGMSRAFASDCQAAAKSVRWKRQINGLKEVARNSRPSVLRITRDDMGRTQRTVRVWNNYLPLVNCRMD